MSSMGNEYPAVGAFPATPRFAGPGESDAVFYIDHRNAAMDCDRAHAVEIWLE